MKYPNLLSIEGLYQDYDHDEHTVTYIDKQWVPARPEGYQSLWSRLYCAWLVLTGKADAVIWPGNQ